MTKICIRITLTVMVHIRGAKKPALLMRLAVSIAATVVFPITLRIPLRLRMRFMVGVQSLNFSNGYSLTSAGVSPSEGEGEARIRQVIICQHTI
jgi:hypothetical protein